MRTSIVVITRDRREQLLRTLDRLTGLPGRPPVVVVDNASSDGTAAAVRRVFPQVLVIEPGRNLGAAGRNLGAARTSTPYVAFADDDSWWAPGALARAEQAFDGAPSLGLVAARVLVGPDERLDPVSAAMARAPLGTAPSLPGPTVTGFLACGAVVRRRAFLSVGGFSPVLGLGGEERLLGLDLAAAGWALVHLPDVVAHHHPQPAGRRPRHRAARQLGNDLVTDWLRLPVRVAAGHTAVLARRAPRDVTAAAALLSLLRRSPAVLTGRAVVPGAVSRALLAVEGAGRAG